MARAPAAKPAAASEASAGGSVGRDDVGFLLAKATQRWNELLAARFAAAGYADLRPSYGSILLPLYEEDGLRIGELARRARLSKQTLTDLVRRLERDGLVERRPDPPLRAGRRGDARRPQPASPRETQQPAPG